MGTQTDVASMGNSDGEAIGDRRPKHAHSLNLGPSGARFVTQTAPDRDFAAGANWTVATPTLTVGPQTTAPTDAPAYQVAGSWFIKYTL